MRICFICQEDIVRPQGGTGTYVRNVSVALAKRGHDVHVIARRRGDTAYQVVEGVKVHRVAAPGPAVLYSPLYFRASRRKFDELHTAKPFDVLHGNLPLMSSFGVQGGELPPVVETLHCTVAEELKALSRQSVRRLNPNEVLVRLLSRVWARRERYLLGRAHHVVSVSEGLKREVIAQYSYSSDRITVIPNGVDYGWFASTASSATDMAKSDLRRKLGISPSDRVILYLGRLMERKRAIDLVRALPSILQSVPNARLIVVGKRNSNAERIETLASELGVRDQVTLVDHVPYAEVPLYYAMADVYCLPSAYEGFPFTVLEAMASGTPVVASDIPGIDEQIEHEENGLLHQVGDIEGIAHNICRVLEEPLLAARLSEAARRLVREQYDWAVIGSRTEQVLQEAAYGATLAEGVAAQWA